MRILHVTRETGTDSRYGIRKGIMPVIEVLRKRGHYVEILDQDAVNKLPSAKIEIWLENLYFKIMRYRFGQQEGEFAIFIIMERVRVGRKAAKYAAKHKFTHIHCHDALLAYIYSIFAYVYGATKCWGYSASAFGRFVQPRLGINISKGSLKYLQRWENKATKRAKWVIAQTSSGLQQMLKDLDIDKVPKNWHVLKNPVTKLSGNGISVRKSIGIDDGEKLIIAVGQLIPMKRFSLLLESVALMPSSQQPYILILGEGTEKEALYDLAKKLSLNRRFDIRTTDDMGDYLAAADLYVSVSSTESFGNANCEAVLAGVPSICTAVGGVPELLGNCAVMVNDNPLEISTAIARLLSSNEERKKLLAKAILVTKDWPAPEKLAIMREKIYACCEFKTNSLMLFQLP
jgi:glycosyltransferase involved in cell wall biosynthesis